MCRAAFGSKAQKSFELEVLENSECLSSYWSYGAKLPELCVEEFSLGADAGITSSAAATVP
jgi:hypothetical protein